MFFIKRGTGGKLTFVPGWGQASLEQISTKQLLNLLNLGPKQHGACSALSHLRAGVGVFMIFMIFFFFEVRKTYETRAIRGALLTSSSTRSFPEKNRTVWRWLAARAISSFTFTGDGSTIRMSWWAPRGQVCQRALVCAEGRQKLIREEWILRVNRRCLRLLCLLYLLRPWRRIHGQHVSLSILVQEGNWGLPVKNNFWAPLLK